MRQFPPPHPIFPCSPTVEYHHQEGARHRHRVDLEPRRSLVEALRPPQSALLVTLLCFLTGISNSAAFRTSCLFASRRQLGTVLGRSSHVGIAPPVGGSGVESVRLQAATAIALPPTCEEVRRSGKTPTKPKSGKKARRKSPQRTASSGKFGARNNIIPLNINRRSGLSKALASKKKFDVAQKKSHRNGAGVASPARAALYDRLWNRRYEELLAFRSVHGHCLVPHNDPNFKLSRWVRNQRRLYKSFAMPPERIRKLNEVDFAWSTRGLTAASGEACGMNWSTSASEGAAANGASYRYTPWSQRLDELRQYKALHGDCNVPQHYEENPQLGRWVKAQRYHYQRMQRDRAKKKSSFTATKRAVQRVRELNELGFCWGTVGSPRKGGGGGKAPRASTSRSSGEDDANGCENGNGVHYRTIRDAQLHAHWRERFKAFR